MKITKMLLMTGAVIALSSCGGDADVVDEMDNPVESTLTADTENSSISWKGMKSEDYFHTGTVGFADGSAMFIDEKLVSGSFNVDMSSIKVTDELPDEKKAKLVGHLGMADFFDVAKNAMVSVACGPYMEGKLPVTMTISGIEISQTVPATVTYEEGKGSITGNFEIDFAALNAAGFQPNPDAPEEPAVSSKVQFELNLMLK